MALMLPLTERRRHLRKILPKGSAIISEALSVTGTGHKLFELMCTHDLEGVVAKRLKDGYGSRVQWLKIKNPSCSQNEGRRELFDRPPRRLGHA
jgi:ATP-dependent DNA ligase